MIAHTGQNAGYDIVTGSLVLIVIFKGIKEIYGHNYEVRCLLCVTDIAKQCITQIKITRSLDWQYFGSTPEIA